MLSYTRLFFVCAMSVKILINAIGQQLIADVKSVSNRETDELIAYWVTEPRAISYQTSEEGGAAIRLSSPCPVAVTTEYSIAKDHIVTVLDPTTEMLEYYNNEVNPEPVVAEIAPPVKTPVADPTKGSEASE